MSEFQNFQGSVDYVAGEELLAAVNVAIALQKPLLIKGEPGTGKTMLAQAIAKSLNKPLIIWNIKSTTKAQDGLYMYDTVQRLYDSQFGNEGVDDIARYIKPGKLCEAFESDEQVECYIHETGRTVKAKHCPIVIITSNAEKELPDAFLRRCIFHYIEFPNQELMRDIVAAHFTDIDEQLLSEAMKAFYSIRGMRDIRKKPSTSELLDWLNALMRGGISPEEIQKKLPFVGVIVKKDEDLETVKANRR